MPAYPTTVATDATLIAADNRASTTLLGTISSGATTVVVNSGVFSAYSVVTIENERILLGTISVSGTYINCTRAYDGSTAAAHNSGVSVRANVVAAHHNVLADELIAVETALGANLRFVSKVNNADGFTFSFSGTTALTGATPATVIITPSPAGITAASVNTHYLYITDGASSESVLLTSVTVGASSTTVGFTPANSHTANQWTLGSATAGIQEAVRYTETISGGGVVQIPAGISTIRQRIYLGGSANSVTLAGERLGCNIQQTTDNPIFYTTSTTQFWSLRGFTTTYSGVLAPTASALSLVGATSGTPTVENLQILGGFYGIATDTFSGLTVRNCRIGLCRASGIYATNVDTTTIQNVTSVSNDVAVAGGSGIYLGGTSSSVIIQGCIAASNAYGIKLAGTLTKLNMSGNIATGNTTQDIYDGATTRTSWAISNNIGATTVEGTLTAANTVTLPTSLPRIITVSGTTTIKTINGFYGTGHEVIFLCPSGLTFDATGNVKVLVTTTYANQPVRGVYNATDSKWYLSLG